MSVKKLNEFQSELSQLQTDFMDVVQALGCLQGFIESDFGMRFQFQAYKSSSPQIEQLVNKIRVLQSKHCNNRTTDNQQNPCPGTSSSGQAATDTVYVPTHAPHSQSYLQQHQQQHPNQANLQYGTSFQTESFNIQQRSYQTYGYQPYQQVNHNPGQCSTQSSAQQGGLNESTNNIKIQTSDEIEGSLDTGGDEGCDDGGFESTEGNESSNVGDEQEADGITNATKTKKRTRKSVPDRNKWVSIAQQKARERGEAYMGTMVIERENGKKQYMFVKPKPARKLGPPCTSAQCRKTTRRCCDRFTEQDRQNIFHDFWKVKTWKEKKAFVSDYVERTFTKYHKDPSQCNRPRTETFCYYLPLNGERLRVCRSLFISTTGTGISMLAKWIKDLAEAPPDSERPVYKPRRKYKKHSEKDPPKMPKDGGWKCPYCLDVSRSRSDFQTHMAKHMEQYAWSD